ncbi:MAG: ABC transporter ATP-binding protein [Holophagales bacterium]|nr:ABC transporter ATP-binding protein [Holophagales bacterium]
MAGHRQNAAAEPQTAALRLRRLEVSYGPFRAVRGVSLEVAPGERVGLLGESGCGKSSLLLASIGLLPHYARCDGRVEIGGRRVEALPEGAWRRIRGPQVGAVFQQPSWALHPLRRAGSQVTDVLRAHGRGSRRVCRERALELFQELGLDVSCFEAYPHQLSGGQQQRVCLARALAPEPALLLADEPTTALDRATEAQVLELVDRLARATRLALLWVSHDPTVLARVARRIDVMYGGQIVERGSASAVLDDPRHPYTRGLLACRPPSAPASDVLKLSADRPLSERALPTLSGEPPSATENLSGCPFEPRCPARPRAGLERCASEPPPWQELGHGRRRRCWLDPEDPGA